MRFKVKTSDLRGAVSNAESVASKMISPTIKHAILLHAAPALGISLTATDLDNVLRVQIPAEVTEGGNAFLSGSKLKGILAVFNQDDVIDTSIDNNTLFLKGGGFEFHIPLIPESEFPEFNLSLAGSSVTFPPGAFQRRIKLVAFARATDMERQPLMGIHVEADENGVRFVATDGRRLACTEASSPAASGPAKVLLSRSFVDGAMRLIPSGEGDLTLSFNATHAKVSSGSYEYKGKIMADEYPNWRSAIPACQKSVVLDREQLLSAFKAAGLIDQNVLLKLDGAACQISSISREGGDARFSFGLQTPAEQLEILLPDKNISDALSAMDSTTIEFQFNNNTSAILLKMPGDGSYLCAINPMVAAKPQ